MLSRRLFRLITGREQLLVKRELIRNLAGPSANILRPKREIGRSPLNNATLDAERKDSLSKDERKNRVGIVGLGSMGRSLARCLMLKYCSPSRLKATVRDKIAAQELNVIEPFDVYTSNRDLIRRCSTNFLAVKPYQMKGVCREIDSELSADDTIISVAAGVDLAHLRKWLPRGTIVRAMPNIPIEIGSGSVALFSEEEDQDFRQNIERMFPGSACLWLDNEDKIDIATAVSGCAQAYIGYFTKVMIESAVDLGLTQFEAERLIETVLSGTGQLCQLSSPTDVIMLTACKKGATERAMEIFKNNDVLYQMVKAVQTSALGRIEEIKSALN